MYTWPLLVEKKKHLFVFFLFFYCKFFTTSGFYNLSPLRYRSEAWGKDLIIISLQAWVNMILHKFKRDKILPQRSKNKQKIPSLDKKLFINDSFRKREELILLSNCTYFRHISVDAQCSAVLIWAETSDTIILETFSLVFALWFCNCCCF